MTNRWKRIFKLFGLFLVLLGSGQAWAHGMSKPGPNGGFVQMPGAFHTELVLSGSSGFEVFLLDEEIKHPTTRRSSVVVSVKQGQGEIKIPCDKATDHFTCHLPEGFRLKLGDSILIRSNRAGSAQGISIYKMPFKRAD